MGERQRGRYRAALSHRDFALLAVSFFVDQVGSWSYSVVIGVDVYQRTHSTAALAGLATARWATGLAVSAYAGVVADRYERTRVMLLSAVASAVVMGGIAACVGFAAPVWTLFALTVGSALAGAPYRPAAGALTPEVVGERDLAAANGIFSGLENLTVVVGPAIGGVLLLLGSPVAGVLVNLASYVVAALLVARLRVRSRGDAAAGQGVIALWLVGVRALSSQRVALTLVAFCALDSAVYGASTVIFVPLSVRLGTGLDGYSYLLAGSALGGVLGATLADRLSASRRLAPVIVASIALEAVPFAVTAAAHAAVPAFLLQVVSGVGMIVVDVLAVSALQRDLAGGVLSRVLGVFDALVTAATMLGSFALAAVLSAYGIVTALVVIGVAFPLLALAGLPVLLRGDRATAARAAELAPRVELLAALDLFTGTGRPVLERLAADATEHQLSARSVVIRQGEPADALWVLAEGVLAVSARGTARRARQLPVVTAPAYVGELGLVRGVPRTATVKAEEDSTLLRIEGSDFLAALESAPPSASFVQLTGARWARTQPRPSAG